jgi:ATP-binding cassette subfamily B (MDR/TAP) protein 1
LQRLLTFVFSCFVALLYVWQLALVTAAAIPFIGVAVAVANQSYARRVSESSSCVDAASSSALEALSAIRTVAAYAQERACLRKMRGLLADARTGGIRMAWARGALEAIVAPIMFVMFALGFWFGAKLIADGMESNPGCRLVDENNEPQDPDQGRCTTGGEVVTSFMAVLFGFTGLVQAMPGFSAISTARTHAAKVYSLIDAPIGDIDAQNGAPGAVPAARASGRIEFRDVRFAYPARREALVYRRLSLTIEAGQTVALVGPSGCGKSTLVALLERFYDVGGGAIELDGANIRGLSVRWLRGQMGLVSQEPVLFSGSVRDNVAVGREGATAAEVEAAAALANAHGFVAALPEGYDTPVGEKGVQLSGGQKQRIAIARAVVRDPAILLLDEATSALDTASEREVQAALDALLRARRMTTLAIAHRLSTVRDADRIFVLEGGELIEHGTHDELVGAEASVYRGLVEAQSMSSVSLLT